jgi:outer membrane receptor protein involved in Fe transport
VPNDPDLQTIGVRDVENERDAFANFSWLHTFGAGAVLTVSPFYHFNRAHYLGKYVGQPDSTITVPEDDRGSNYMGGVVSLGVNRGRHNLRTGFQVFGQRDNQLFAVAAGDGTQTVPAQRERIWGNVEALFLQDQFKATSWLTFNAGLRLTHFANSPGPSSGLRAVSENAADPRVGAAVHIPKLGWVARAFWGRYYQAPPLLSIGGPLLEQCNTAECGFLPLHGERDEQREFGLTIPVAGWTVDFSNFRTGAKNFFDHDVLGNSNIFFPLSIDRARIRGWEATAMSPRIAGVLQWHFAYSNQIAQGRGDVTGGLTNFESPQDNYFFLDHDQRTTISTGVNVDLPRHAWTAFNVAHGSGFLDGDGPAHLPPHTSYDLSLGKSFGENWSVRLTALNLTNARYMVDASNTFGGSHFENPRQLSLQVKYRFKY